MAPLPHNWVSYRCGFGSERRGRSGRGCPISTYFPCTENRELVYPNVLQPSDARHLNSPGDGNNRTFCSRKLHSLYTTPKHRYGRAHVGFTHGTCGNPARRCFHSTTKQREIMCPRGRTSVFTHNMSHTNRLNMSASVRGTPKAEHTPRPINFIYSRLGSLMIQSKDNWQAR